MNNLTATIAVVMAGIDFMPYLYLTLLIVSGTIMALGLCQSAKHGDRMMDEYFDKTKL